LTTPSSWTMLRHGGPMALGYVQTVAPFSLGCMIEKYFPYWYYHKYPLVLCFQHAVAESFSWSLSSKSQVWPPTTIPHLLVYKYASWQDAPIIIHTVRIWLLKHFSSFTPMPVLVAQRQTMAVQKPGSPTNATPTCVRFASRVAQLATTCRWPFLRRLKAKVSGRVKSPAIPSTRFSRQFLPISYATETSRTPTSKF